MQHYTPVDDVLYTYFLQTFRSVASYAPQKPLSFESIVVLDEVRPLTIDSALSPTVSAVISVPHWAGQGVGDRAND